MDSHVQVWRMCGNFVTSWVDEKDLKPHWTEFATYSKLNNMLGLLCICSPTFGFIWRKLSEFSFFIESVFTNCILLALKTPHVHLWVWRYLYIDLNVEKTWTWHIEATATVQLYSSKNPLQPLFIVLFQHCTADKLELLIWYEWKWKWENVTRERRQEDSRFGRTSWD